MSATTWIHNTRRAIRITQLLIIYLLLATLSILLQFWNPLRPRRLLVNATNRIVQTATNCINANIKEHNARTRQEPELSCTPYSTLSAEKKSAQWITAQETAGTIAGCLFFGSWFMLACAAVLGINVLDLVICRLKMQGHFPGICVFACGCEAIPKGVLWHEYVKAGTIWRLRGFMIGFSGMGVIMALYTVIFTIMSKRRRPGWRAVEALTP